MTRWVCCYDVPANRRRARLFKALRVYLRPVQKSVFEGDLTARARKSLERDVMAVIDPSKDTVRLYPLCASCQERTVLLGVSPVVPGPDAPILL